MENNLESVIPDNEAREGLTSFLEQLDKGVEASNEQPQNTTEETPVETPPSEGGNEVVKEGETKEAPAATTTETSETKNPLFDLLTSTETTQVETTEPAKEVELPSEIAEKLALLEQYEAQVNAIKENPLMKALAFAESPEQIRKIAREIAGEDVAKLTINDLLAREAASIGLQGEELQLAIDEELSNYQSMTTLQKRNYENQLRSKYDRGGESELLKQIEAAFQSKQDKAVDPIAEEKAYQEAVKNDETLLQDFAKKYVGQEVNGVKVGEDFAQKLNDAYYDPKYALFDDKGNFNAGVLARLVFWDTYGATILNAQKDIAKREVIKERSNPSKDGIIGSQTPAVDNRTDDEKLIEGLLNGEINFFNPNK